MARKGLCHPTRQVEPVGGVQPGSTRGVRPTNFSFRGGGRWANTFRGPLTPRASSCARAGCEHGVSLVGARLT